MEKHEKRAVIKQFRDTLRTREFESRAICARIRASSGLDRAAAWDEKRTYGDVTRCILLAYGFVRGLPYETIEKNTRCVPAMGRISRAAGEVGAGTALPSLVDSDIEAWVFKPAATEAA
jgi:hypothetical protein